MTTTLLLVNYPTRLSVPTSRTVSVTASILCSYLSASAAMAATSEKASNIGGALVEEVVVTAQKRSERLQDVPISISVVDGRTLDRSPVVGLTDILTRIPGVVTERGNQGGGTQITVRGVTAAQQLFGGSSPIAYYLDSVPFGLVKSSVVPDASAYDMDHVEVLRGPQGTLYGASALNGVVRVLTHDADLNSFEFKARTGTSSIQDGGTSYRGDMAVNVPIVDDKLAARLVVGYQNFGGWIDSLDRKDINDGETRNIRLKVNAKPTDGLSVGLSAWTSRSDYGAQAAGFVDRRVPIALQPEPIVTDFDNFGLKIAYELPSFSITSSTGHLEYKNDSFIDLARLGLTNSRIQTLLEADSFSEELVATSSSKGPWKWTLGAMYRDSEDRRYQYRTNSASYRAPSDLRAFSRSTAIFGELTRSFFGDRLDLTGGLRYFEDDVRLREDSRRTEVGGIPAAGLIRDQAKFDKVTPRAVVTWHIADETMAYASYSEGFRSGSQQDPTVLSTYPTFVQTKPDTLKNYELGTKATFAGGRVAIDAAVYYVDWTDLQLTLGVPIPPNQNVVFATALVNSQSASGMGMDLGITARPVDRLNVGLSLSYNDITLDQDVFTSGLILFHKGDRLPRSPERTFAASADYSIPLGSAGYEGSIGVMANYRRKAMTEKSLVSGQYLPSVGDSMWNGQASISIASPSHWTASLFVDNITDEEGSPSRFVLIPAFDLRVQPRTIGVQVEFSFK